MKKLVVLALCAVCSFVGGCVTEVGPADEECVEVGAPTGTTSIGTVSAKEAVGCETDADCDVDWEGHCSLDTCKGGECFHATVDCGGVATTQCTSDEWCDAGNQCVGGKCKDGECMFSPYNGVACDDGNPCTENGTCKFGACNAVGSAVLCDDGDKFTNDLCDPSTGCYHVQIPQ
jgi:hypothetical protein